VKREFPRGKADTKPTEGNLDELMADPPEISARGSLEGYRDGSRVRRKVYIGLVAGAAIAVLGGHWYARHLEHQRKNPEAHYTVAEGAEDEIRPRSLQWNDGYARLALSRDPPGVNQIVLPDRTIQLAKGVDTAQVKVKVIDGKTVQLKVISGDIAVVEN